eukprot:9503578-Pyramimonas_sp.AAC.1
MSSFPDLVALGNGEVSLGNGVVASLTKSPLGNIVRQPWSVKVNSRAVAIVNPIRQVIEQMGRPNPDKELISLAQGEPHLCVAMRTNKPSRPETLEEVRCKSVVKCRLPT